jgi:hypothetical protein
MNLLKVVIYVFESMKSCIKSVVLLENEITPLNNV